MFSEGFSALEKIAVIFPQISNLIFYFRFLHFIYYKMIQFIVLLRRMYKT
jgi:hypothetical protein